MEPDACIMASRIREREQIMRKKTHLEASRRPWTTTEGLVEAVEEGEFRKARRETLDSTRPGAARRRDEEYEVDRRDEHMEAMQGTDIARGGKQVASGRQVGEKRIALGSGDPFICNVRRSIYFQILVEGASVGERTELSVGPSEKYVRRTERKRTDRDFPSRRFTSTALLSPQRLVL